MAADDSKIAMFKAMIACAWADGVLEEAERKKLMKYISGNKYLDDAQRAELTAAIDQKISLDEVWSDITNPADRAYLIDVAREIFWVDGVFAAEEKALHDDMMVRFMDELHKRNPRK